VPRAIYCWLAVPNATKSIVVNNPAGGNFAYNDVLDWSDCPGYQATYLSLSFNGTGGIFSSITSPIQLYEEFMGRQGYCKQYCETGYVTAIQQANNGVMNIGTYGSVIRIDGSQLPLDWTKYTIGSTLNANLQVTMRGTNLSSVANTPTLFVQVINDNLLEIDGPTSAHIYNGLLNPEEVMAIRKSAPYDNSYQPIIGSGLFDKFKDKLKRVAKYVVDNRDKILPLVKGAVGSKLHHRRHRSRKHGSALVAGARRHRRHHLRGGNLNDNESDSYSDSYSDTDSYMDTDSMDYSSEDEHEAPKSILKGGKLISKSALQKRLK
jgi:hypothetical protein